MIYLNKVFNSNFILGFTMTVNLFKLISVFLSATLLLTGLTDNAFALRPAASASRNGFETAFLSGDILGPAIPYAKANPFVESELKRRIAEKGKITFRDYMQVSLYNPEGGYYSSGTVEIGARTDEGHFLTFPETMQPYFGEAIARQIIQMWENMDFPENFDIVEMGAGNGTLARDILAYLRKNSPSLFDRLKYNIIEISPALVQRQIDKIGKGMRGGRFLDKVEHIGIDDIDKIQGVFISNELPDAMPVHRVRLSDGRLQELYITLNREGNFIEVWDDLSTDQIQVYIDQIYRLEGLNSVEELLKGIDIDIPVNLDAAKWYRRISDALDKGYILTIDYGFIGTSIKRWANFFGLIDISQNGGIRLYGMPPGQNNIYDYSGEVDITSDVYFPILKYIGEQNNMNTEGYISQRAFLKNLKVPEDLLNFDSYNDHAFVVLIQSKNAEGRLTGMKNAFDIDKLLIGIDADGLRLFEGPPEASYSSAGISIPLQHNTHTLKALDSAA
jgi:SAM-dependent MidA family methyltransferase